MNEKEYMIQWRLVFFFALVLPQYLAAQNVVLEYLAPLPPVLAESSGLALTGPNTLWSHNDGGAPALIAFDTTGALLRTLNISNATNIDWEDLARDDFGNLYIGDFGNNANTRQNLRIYRIPNPNLIAGNTTTAAIIDFHFADQLAFPPPAAQWNYDVEAMIWHHDSLYLFTKNRTVPFDGYTRLYGLSALPGTRIATLLDSFYTGPGPKELWWITAADLRPDGKQLALLSSDKLWLFSCFEAPRFFSGSVRQLNFGLSQKEALAYQGNGKLLITDEVAPVIGGGRLYRLDVSPWIRPVDLGPDRLITAESLVLDAGNPGAAYLWSTGQTTRFITVHASGSYSVAVRFPNGCTAADTLEVSFLSTGLPPAPAPLPLRLSPNPARDLLTIEGDFRPGIPLRVRIWSAAGTLALDHDFLPRESRLKLRLPYLAPGLYLLEVRQEGRFQAGRLAVPGF